MNKSDLVAQVAKDTKLSKSEAEKALNSIVSNVQNTLKKGDSVSLVGFGTWSVAKRNARTGRNPQTGAPIKIPAKKVPKFSPGKGLRDSV